MSIGLAIVIWIIGIIIMFGGKIADNILRHFEHKLEEKAKHNKFDDNSAHIVYGAGSRILDAIPWYAVNTIFIIAGLVVMALGFVSLSFHAIYSPNPLLR